MFVEVKPTFFPTVICFLLISGMFSHFPAQIAPASSSLPNNYNTPWSLLCVLSFLLTARDLFLAVSGRVSLSSSFDLKVLKGYIRGLLGHSVDQNSRPRY